MQGAAGAECEGGVHMRTFCALIWEVVLAINSPVYMAVCTDMGYGSTALVAEEHKRLMCAKACRELAVANAYTSFS